jgi:hypothetical protein
MFAGRPTARKVQPPSGRWMTQEANADTPKGDGKPPTARFGSSAGWLAHNRSDTGVLLGPKGS